MKMLGAGYYHHLLPGHDGSLMVDAVLLILQASLAPTS